MADDESRKGLLRRCGRRWLIVGILAAVIIVVVIAIIIAAVVTNKTSDDEQKVGGLKAPEECEDVSVQLGKEIIINCAINNDTWRQQTLPLTIKALHNNPLLNMMVDCSAVGRKVTCKLGRANCSSRGRVDIKFSNSLNENAQPEFSKSVTVQIKAGSLNTTITQEYQNNTNTSVFHLSCGYENDCDTHEMQFYGNGHFLAYPLECSESSFTDTDGHFMSCTATVPEDVILKYGNASNLYCRLTNGQNSTFDFPTCGDFSKSNDNCNTATRSLFDCTSDTTGTVIVGHTECELIKVCYPLRYVVGQNNTCRLQWCRNSTDLHIDTSWDNLFVPLCNQ